MSKHENVKKHVLGRILGAAVLGAGAVAAVRTVRAIVSAKADEAVRTYGEPEPECAPENGCEESDSCTPAAARRKPPAARRKQPPPKRLRRRLPARARRKGTMRKHERLCPLL